MSAATAERPDIRIECPCCGARIVIDAKLGKVVTHEPPPRQSHAPDLDHAAALLRKQQEHREAVFKQSTEDEKTKSQLLERKFAEALKKSKDEPVTKPMRDFDLE